MSKKTAEQCEAMEILSDSNPYEECINELLSLLHSMTGKSGECRVYGISQAAASLDERAAGVMEAIHALRALSEIPR
jgi:hypothetical protein